jgi:hypothetical protein
MSEQWEAWSDSYGKERRVYKAKNPSATIDELAKITGLEANSFKYWGEVAQWKRHPVTGRLYPHIVSVPNVWIEVDALRGGSWHWDIPFVNPGGSIGGFFGTDLFTYGKKVEKIKSIKELMDFLKTPFKRRNIWGMVIFAHGDEHGNINTTGEKGERSQMYIIYELRKNKYRMARAFLMQCFSGCEGRSSLNLRTKNEKSVKQFIYQHLKDADNVKIENRKENLYRITFDIDWRIEWGSVTVTDPFTYKNMNILMVDLDIFLGWF